MQKTDLAYMAGIVDGEGTITGYYWPKKHHFMTECVVINTHLPLMLWIKGKFGGVINTVKRKNTPKGRKLVYCWRLPSAKRIYFIKSILPFLKEKRPRAELVIKLITEIRDNGYSKINIDKRISIVNKLKELHR